MIRAVQGADTQLWSGSLLELATVRWVSQCPASDTMQNYNSVVTKFNQAAEAPAGVSLLTVFDHARLQGACAS